MRVVRELKKSLFDASSLALGVFDGVHTGHRKVIEGAVNKAHELGIPSAVVTFSVHPKSIIMYTNPEMITTLEEKIELFGEMGVDATVVLDFSPELAKMTAKEYLTNILGECLGAKSLSVGYNHQFGSDRKGTGDFLRQYCCENNIFLNIVPPVKIDNHVVSSSVIRGFILDGDVLSASQFLGRPFNIKGKVVEGERIGRKIGFPTANLQPDDEIILPLRGVYSGLAEVEGIKYKAVINVGRKPTVGELEKDLVEAHILSFNEDIYGKIISVYFLDRIRDEKKFNSLDELKIQIQTDCSLTEKYG